MTTMNDCAVTPMSDHVERFKQQLRDGWRIRTEAPDGLAGSSYGAREFGDALLSALAAQPAEAGVTVKASDIVDALFKDLRDRRFLKWLFDERGDKCVIGQFYGGDTLTALDLETQDEIRKAWVDIIRSALAPTPAPRVEVEPTGRVRVPQGQTPLDDKLGHRLLDVFREGGEARDSGGGSPYHGHSLEHCLHAAGWVQRDLRLALDAAKSDEKAALPTPAPQGMEIERLTIERDTYYAKAQSLQSALDDMNEAYDKIGAELDDLRAPLALQGMDGNRALPYDRDTLGRFVREAWVRWAETQPQPKPSWLVPYDELSEPDKEADRQIGEAVARWTLIGDAARSSLLTAPQGMDTAVEAHPLARFGSGQVAGLGLYRVHWKSGGSSLAAIGMMENGDRWIAPTNWVRPSTISSAGEWGEIERLEQIDPDATPQPAPSVTTPWGWVCSGEGDGWKETDKFVRDPELVARYRGNPNWHTIVPLYPQPAPSGVNAEMLAALDDFIQGGENCSGPVNGIHLKHLREWRIAIAAAEATRTKGVEGWVLVPVEPTDAEIEAGCRAIHELQGTEDADAPMQSPYQNSWDAPDSVRWKQWDETVREVRSAILSAAPKQGGE